MPSKNSESDSSEDPEERIEELEDDVEDLEDKVRDLEDETPEIGLMFGSMMDGSVQLKLEGSNGDSTQDLADITEDMLPSLVDQASRFESEEEEEFNPEVQ